MAKLLISQVAEVKIANDTMKETDFYNLMHPVRGLCRDVVINRYYDAMTLTLPIPWFTNEKPILLKAVKSSLRFFKNLLT